MKPGNYGHSMDCEKLSEVVLFLRSISMYWIYLGTDVTVLSSQVVPISQVILKTGVTVYACTRNSISTRLTWGRIQLSTLSWLPQGRAEKPASRVSQNTSHLCTEVNQKNIDVSNFPQWTDRDHGNQWLYIPPYEYSSGPARRHRHADFDCLRTFDFCKCS